MAEENSQTLSVGDLKNLIDTRLTEIMKSGNKPSSEEPKDRKPSSLSIEEQVAESLARIKAKEEAESKEKTLTEKIAELEKRTAEKPPVERSRIHKLMGWGD